VHTDFSSNEHFVVASHRRESPDFPSSDECNLTALLLDAFEKQDAEALKKVQAKQTLNFLENPIVRMAKQLKVASADAGADGADEGLA
jgi:hypothetical protein